MRTGSCVCASRRSRSVGGASRGPAPCRWVVLLGWLSVCLGPSWFAGAEEKPADAATVCMVSLLGAPHEKELAAAMEAKANAEAGAQRVRVVSLQTMGSEDGASAALKEIGEAKPSLVVFRDASSAAALSGQLHEPWMAIVRSRVTLTAALEKHGGGPAPAHVFETLPSPAAMTEAIAALRPSPSHLGIVYTPEEATSRQFVDGLRQSLESAQSSVAIVECRLRPGACRNSKETEAALKDSLGSLGKGALVLALPESNTVKFAFVLAAFAKEREAALLGLDDFRPGQTLLNLAYSPETVADQCVIALREHTDARAGATGAPGDAVPLPALYLDKAKITELGYTVDADMLKRSRPVWSSAETSATAHGLKE